MLKFLYKVQIQTLGLLLISALVIYLSAKMFMSSLYSWQTNLFLSYWTEKSQTTEQVVFIPSHEAWLNADKAIKKSINSYPIANAFLQEKQGKVLQWKTYSKPFDDVESKKNRDKTLEAYRKQTKLTPSWPKAWLNLMSIKIERQEFDEEFYNAFNKVEQTSNQNPIIRTRFAQLGIRAWSGLDEITQSKVLKIIATEVSSSSKNSRNIKPLLQAHNLLGIICVYTKLKEIRTFKLCL